MAARRRQGGIDFVSADPAADELFFQAQILLRQLTAGI
jgi:hypothetical protein